jgi:hypothetical protein
MKVLSVSSPLFSAQMLKATVAFLENCVIGKKLEFRIYQGGLEQWDT